MTADTSKTGFEILIVGSLIDKGGHVVGDPKDYDHAVRVAKLFGYSDAKQSEAVETLDIGADNLQRIRFLRRLRDKIDKRGVIDVLRKGFMREPAFDGVVPGRADLRQREGGSPVCRERLQRRAAVPPFERRNPARA